jgi:hypothetical protein
LIKGSFPDSGLACGTLATSSAVFLASSFLKSELTSRFLKLRFFFVWL